MSKLVFRRARPVRFGPWPSPGAEFDLGAGLSVIVGPNEAGKSSLVALLRAVLYGFRPASRDRYPWVPFGEDRAELEADLEIAGEEYTVGRRLLSQPQGWLAGPRSREDLRNSPLPAAAHVPDEIFGTAYCLDLEALVAPEGAAWTSIEQRLLGGEPDPDVRPAAEVLATLDREITSLGEARGRLRRGDIGRATQVRDDVRDRLLEARRNEARLQELDRDLAAATDDLESVERQIARLRDDRRELQPRRDHLVNLTARASALERSLADTESVRRVSAARFAELSATLLAPGASPAGLPPAGSLRGLAEQLRVAERDLDVARQIAAIPGARLVVPAIVVAGVGLVALVALPETIGRVLAGMALAVIAVLAWSGRRAAPRGGLPTAARAASATRQRVQETLAASGLVGNLAAGASVELLERLAAAADEGERLAAARRATDQNQQALRSILDEALTGRNSTGGSVTADLESLVQESGARLIEIDHELDAAGRRRDQLMDAGRSLGAEYERLLSASPIDMLTGELRTAEDDLAALARQRSRLEVLRDLIREAQRRHRERFEPVVLKRSGELLIAVTGGRYHRVHTGSEPALDSPAEFGLQGPSGLLPLARASHGTRDQLLLALRLAVAEEFDSGGPRLPLILDEPLVNWDADRRWKGLALLAEIAERRQVILLTCHEWLVSEAVAAGAFACRLPIRV